MVVSYAVVNASRSTRKNITLALLTVSMELMNIISLGDFHNIHWGSLGFALCHSVADGILLIIVGVIIEGKRGEGGFLVCVSHLLLSTKSKYGNKSNCISNYDTSMIY